MTFSFPLDNQKMSIETTKEFMHPRIKRLSKFLSALFFDSTLCGHKYKLDTLNEELRDKITKGVFRKFVFYGMGCSSVVSDIVKGFFLTNDVDIEVEVVNDYDAEWFVSDRVLAATAISRFSAESINITTVNVVALGWTSTMTPVNALRAAPIATMIDPEGPEAVADKSCRTNMTAEFALGIESPFPRPAKNVPPKKLQDETPPINKTSKHAVRRKVDTQRPSNIMVINLRLVESLPDKKLPTSKPMVMDPMPKPICTCDNSICSAPTNGTPLINT